MAANLAHGPLQVRVLKKVRRQFLHKVPDGNQPRGVLPAALLTPEERTYPINPSLGFIEKNRKLCIGDEIVNCYFNIASTHVKSQPGSRIVTLNMSPNENNNPLPFECTVKRLESYGDLELSTWAHRLRNYQIGYTKAIASYYEGLRSDDPQMQAAYRKSQIQARLACHEVESQYPFLKYVQLLKEDTNQLLSCSYNEGCLKEIGHTPESFVSWAQENGVPKIFETSNELYQKFVKGFLAYAPMIAHPVLEGEEAETIIYDKDNRPRKVTMKTVSVLEATSEAPINHCYAILCTKSADLEENMDAMEVNHKRRVGHLDETVDSS